MTLNRILLASAVCVGSIAIAESTAEAGDCYYGRGHHARGYGSAFAYRAPVVAYRAPVVVARPYYGPAAPIYRHASPSYRAYSPYRGSYIGPNAGFGYGGYGRYGVNRGYRGYGYGRSGISIGIGF